MLSNEAVDKQGLNYWLATRKRNPLFSRLHSCRSGSLYIPRIIGTLIGIGQTAPSSTGIEFIWSGTSRTLHEAIHQTRQRRAQRGSMAPRVNLPKVYLSSDPLDSPVVAKPAISHFVSRRTRWTRWTRRGYETFRLSASAFIWANLRRNWLVTGPKRRVVSFCRVHDITLPC